MSEEKRFSFNVGDTPLCPVEIVGLCGGVYGTKAIVELDDGTQGKVYKSSLVPALKEGEYTLTLDEVVSLVEMFCYDRFPGEPIVYRMFHPLAGREISRDIVRTMLESFKKSKGGTHD